MDAIQRVFGAAATRTYSGDANAEFLQQLQRLSSSQLADIRLYLMSQRERTLASDFQRLSSRNGILGYEKAVILKAMAAYGIALPPPPMPAPLSGRPAEFSQDQFGGTGSTPPPPPDATRLSGRPAEFSQDQFGGTGSTPPPPPMPAPLGGRPAEFSQGQFGPGDVTPPPPPFAVLPPWDSEFESMFDVQDETHLLQVLASISSAYSYYGADRGYYSSVMHGSNLEFIEGLLNSDISLALKKEAQALYDALKVATESGGLWYAQHTPSLSFAAIEGSSPTSGEIQSAVEAYVLHGARIAGAVEFYEKTGLSSTSVVTTMVTGQWGPNTNARLTVQEALDTLGTPNELIDFNGELALFYY